MFFRLFQRWSCCSLPETKFPEHRQSAGGFLSTAHDPPERKMKEDSGQLPFARKNHQDQIVPLRSQHDKSHAFSDSVEFHDEILARSGIRYATIHFLKDS